MNVRCLPLLLILSLTASRAWSQAGNDQFAQRIQLTGSSVTAVSNLRTATHEAGEPNHANNSGARSLWWTWTAPATGTVNFSTFGGGATPGWAATTANTRALAVYTGDSPASLSEVASAGTLAVRAQTGNAPAGPSCNVPVTAGTTYQIAVDGPALLEYPDDGTTVLAINQAPAIYSAAGASGTVGASFTYTVQASNNPTGFAATDLPAGLSLNPTTGDLTGVLPAAGVYTIHLAATGPGGTGTGTLTLVVSAAASAAPPSAPVITSAAAVAGCVGAPFSYWVYAGNAVSYTADNLPPGLSLDTTYGYLRGTPTAAGVYNVPVTATNAAGTARATVAVNIAAAPRRPVITSGLSATGKVGGSLSYSITVADTSDIGKPTGYSAGTLPPGLGFDPGTGNLQGVPTQAGTWSVPVSASNAGGTGSAVVTVVVATASSASSGTTQAAPPVLTSSATATGSVGGTFAYRLAASNAPTAYSAVDNLPPGLSLNAANGYITGVPTAAGVYRVPVAASNDYGTSNATLTINVLATAPASSAAPPPAVFSSAAEAVGYVGGSFYYQTLASSPDPFYRNNYLGSGGSNTAIFTASGLPPGLSISAIGGSISGTPTTAGTYAATVTVTPPYYYYPTTGVGSATVTFVISSGNAPGPSAAPVFTSQATLPLNTATTYSAVTFTTASNNPTAYTAGTLPPGLTFNASNGTVSGKPTAAGSYAVPVTASNAAGTGTATLTILVTAATTTTPAPGLTSSLAAAGAVGAAFTYTIGTNYTATAYTVGTLPPGLSQSAGTISGTPTQAGAYPVPISVSNVGGTTTGTLTITVAASPTAPVINGYANVRGTLGQSLSYSINASDVSASYTAANLPPGLSLSASGGTISGTPTQAGVWSVPVTATSAAGTGTATVAFTVVAPAPPVFSSLAAASGTVGSAFSYSLSASSYVTAYTAASLPPGLSINASSGYISGTPTQAGVYPVPVTAANAGGTTGATLTVTVVNASSAAAPVISSAAAATGTVGAAFSYTITASGSPTSYDLGASLPAGLSFSPSTGTISGTPAKAGTYVLPVSATNAGGTGQAKVTLAFSAMPTAAPVITSPAEFQAYTSDSVYYPVTATNGPTGFAASGLPPGLSINPATGVISGVLTNTTTATFPVVVTATNNVGQGTATLVVVNGLGATGRVTSALSANGTVGTAFSYAVTTNYASNYSFSASGLPPGLSPNTSTGVISGTPTASGTYLATVSVSTPNGTATGRVRFNVTAAASPLPVLASAAGANAAVGDAFYYFPTFGNGPTSVTVSSLPAGLSYDAAKGLVSGSPTTAGTYSVVVSATNGTGTTSGILTLVVTATYNNSAKFVSAAGAGATVGTAFTYTAATNQPSSSYFAATNLPPGLTYDLNTFKITGTPTTAGVYTCKLTASTPQGTPTGYLTIAVGDGTGVPPVITSAAAAGGTYGSAFSYTLAASGTPAGYTVGGLPAGLSFDPAAGTVSGTPTATGTFNVPVSAANAAGTGNATLTFVVAAAAPSLNTLALEVTATLGTPAVVLRLPATGGTVAYTVGGLPAGLSLDPVSGTVSGTPAASGIYPVTVSAANAYGSTGVVVDIAVKDPATAPVFYSTGASVTGLVGASVSDGMYAPGSGTVTHTADGLPPGLFLNAATGLIFGTPTAAGTYPVTLTATNAVGSDRLTLTFLIAPASSLPVFSSGRLAVAGSVGASFSASAGVSNATACAAGGLPPGMSYSFSSGYVYLQGTPTAAGLYPVTLTASNATGSSSAVVTLAVDGGPPAAPAIYGAAGAAGYVGTAFKYAITCDSTPTAYGASGLPDGLQVNAVTGAITGTPTTAGTYAVTVTAANAGGTGSAVVTIGVSAAVPAANAVPVITSAASVYYSPVRSTYYHAETGANFAYTITASNAPTGFTATGLPAGLTLNPATGSITGRLLAAGTFTVPISATNALGTGQAVLKIMAPASLPALSLPLTVSGTVGSALTYAASPYSSSYAAGNTTVSEPTAFAASGLPPGLSFDPATGIVAGTPSQAGTFAATFTATDRAGSTAATVNFIIAAGPASVSGSAPIVTGNAVASGYVGVPLSAYVYGGATFTAGSLPAGLGLDPSTGRLSGTPAAVGVYTVPITASNIYGTGGATLTLDIAAAPAAPLITSSAGAGATVGSAFVYALYTGSTAGAVWPATDYGASGLPPGLGLGANGFITGTPTAAGLYTVPVSATAGGVTGNATLTLNVLPAPANPAPATPVSSGPAGTLGFVGTPFSLALGTAGFTVNGALPPGLVYDAASGALTGTPTAAGSVDLAFSADGTGGAPAGRSALNLRIIAPDLALPRITGQPADTTTAQDSPASLAAAVSGAPVPVFQWLRDGAAVPGATGPVLDFSAAQPADAGTYVLVATNSSGRAVSSGARLTVTQTYDRWTAANFTAAEIAAGQAASGYDFNGDGLPNLLEYALDRDPRTGQGGGLPAGTRSADGVLQLRFTRDTGRTDLVYTVEASSDLLAWTPIARSTAGGPTVNLGGAGAVSEGAPVGGAAAVTVQDGTQTGARRFLRLRVERP